MIQSQIVPINFGQGIDSKTDEKLVVHGKLTLLENGVFTIGRKIIKRNGYTALGSDILGSTDSINQGDALAVFNDELCLFSDDRLYSYSESSDNWIDKGDCSSVSVGKKEIVRNSYSQTLADMATLNGVTVYAWKDSRGGVRASVYDANTGSHFQSDVSLSSSGDNPKVIAFGTAIFVFYNETGSIYLRRLVPGTPQTFETAYLVGNDLISGYLFDVAVSGTKGVIVYKTSGGMAMKYIRDNGTIGTTTYNLPNPITISEAPAGCLTVCVDQNTGNIWVYWQIDASCIKYKIYYADFTEYKATTVLDSDTLIRPGRIVAIQNGSNQNVYYEVSTAYDAGSGLYINIQNTANGNKGYIKQAVAVPSGSPAASSVFAKSVGVYSKPWIYNSKVYLVASYGSTLQSQYFIYNENGNVVGKILPQLGGGHRSNHTAAEANFSNDVVQVATEIKTRFISEDNSFFTPTGVALSTINHQPTNKYICKKLGENLQIGGGMLQMYDGQSVVENGFHIFPEDVVPFTSTSGGSIAAGTYLYYVVYEWFDNKGQLHRSSPSTGTSITTTGATSTNTLRIQTLRVTAKKSPRTNVQVVVYRTKADQTIPYRLTSFTSPTYNDPTADSVDYVDTVADSAIGSNEILYTVGGILENIAPNACEFFDVYKNRLVVLESENKLTLNYSKTKLKNEGVAFSDTFKINVEPFGGDATCVKFMDDKLLIFKKNNIYVMSGNGPTDTGAQNDFSVPELVPSDVGCPYPRSLVLMPDGVMFKSYKGIYLINRSLSVSYIGADVEAYNSQNIVSAELMETKNQVRFLTDAGYSLVYDYYFGQWSTFTNHEGLDADNWKGLYVYLKDSGEVYKEAPSYYKDKNSAFKLRIATAWLKFSGIQGFQRIRKFSVLGNYASSHILKVSLGYDYESFYQYQVLFNAGTIMQTNTYGDDVTYGDSTPYGGVDSGVYQFRAHAPRQKCESIRFLFEDLTAGDPGQSYSLSDLSLEVGVKSGLNRMKASRTVG